MNELPGRLRVLLAIKYPFEHPSIFIEYFLQHLMRHFGWIPRSEDRFYWDVILN